MRPRELWFSLGGAALVVGTVFSALAVGYFAKEQHYSLSSSPQMIGAYIAFALAVVCFGSAIAGWGPWLRWQGFPDITVIVSGVGAVVADKVLPGPVAQKTSLTILKVYFINGNADRNVCIRTVYLRGKTKPGSPWGYWQVFTEPSDPMEYHNPVKALELPLNLPPRAGAGGYLIFDIPAYLSEGLASPEEADWVVEIHEALSGKMAIFPALAVGGVYRRRRGLVPTTIKERVTGPPLPPIRTRGAPWERQGSPWPDGVPPY